MERVAAPPDEDIKPFGARVAMGQIGRAHV